MNDTVAPAPFAVTYLLDTALYVEHGAANYTGTDREWADEFRALGGTQATVSPAWRTGAPSATLTVAGTPEAVAFAASTYALAAA